ncbi:hypothetical protein GCM10010975_30000 [Comamonas phosphati]|nr:hypothetical protein GCM10010975_30000 [Comamonas phosphati]
MNHLKSWQYRFLYAAVGALALSGAAWLAVHYLWGAGAGNLPHPLEPWLMRLHGAAGFAGLFMTGVLAAAHVPQGWRMTTRNPKLRMRKASQRRTGLVLCFLGLVGILSGYLLYYFAPENVRAVLGWSHALLGMALALLLPLHGRRRFDAIHG